MGVTLVVQQNEGDQKGFGKTYRGAVGRSGVGGRNWEGAGRYRPGVASGRDVSSGVYWLMGSLADRAGKNLSRWQEAALAAIFVSEGLNLMSGRPKRLMGRESWTLW